MSAKFPGGGAGPFLARSLIAVYTHCQMNENPCSNQEIHALFEHGYELENT